MSEGDPRGSIREIAAKGFSRCMSVQENRFGGAFPQWGVSPVLQHYIPPSFPLKPKATKEFAD
eukprot:CAMPEP_0117844892 /NCGR_PEP_ID=MMETSP0949-20121206/17877_1 /TAXON_ID=44440 /ORGANISM="Chattonella subsalsa, Strain CCMP2191" /LENGTH=62 /DNA_ID=CAMNT_0005690211 /DNA_START=133 /DNA_END=318 /DNA_ORIENTATION=+